MPDPGATDLFKKMLEGPQRPITFLWVALCLMIIGVVAIPSIVALTSGWTEIALSVFVGLFLLLIGVGLFLVVYFRPLHLTVPTTYRENPTFPEVAEALNRSGQSVQSTVVAGRVIETAVVQRSLEEPEETEGDSPASDAAPPPMLESGETPTWESVLIGEILSPNMDLERANDAFQRVQLEEKNPSRRLMNEVFYLYRRLQSGDTAALSRIKDLAESSEQLPDVSSEAYLYLGIAYQTVGSFDRALEQQQRAIELAQNESQKAQATLGAANSLDRLGERDRAFRLLREIAASTNDDDQAAHLYRRIAEMYEETNEHLMRALALERALYRTPENTHIRFDAAYSYNDADMRDMSYLHYQRILQVEPQHSMALNNIALDYSSLDLPIKAVESLRKSYSLGETLAAANIANRLLQVGFADDAESLLTEAVRADEPHRNVHSGLSSISTQREKESKKSDQLTNLARQKQTFLLAYSNLLMSADQPSWSFEGSWVAHAGTVVTFALEGGILGGYWEEAQRRYEIKATPEAATALVNGIEWKYAGTGVWGGFAASGGFMYLDEDGAKLHLMYYERNETTYLHFSRSADATEG